ncbi:sigma 54-interacting transcriptional regulator [Halobacillus sp. Marseille-Q1614]|uniref:sigma 54-interacting transcriptional regulator n=1 Tax=Halobacillus sp. Marseille-Q1614 TaxID=2709134 RepID=UPI0020C1CF50|nr:sigma 54-interacting transcriptional regulator [Halobacillus sp. Marseille-Q1614]
MQNEYLQDLEVNNEEKLLKVENWMSPLPFYITIEKTAREAAGKMEELDLDCLPVIDKNRFPVGVLTAKSLLHRFVRGEIDQQIGKVLTNEKSSVVSCQDSLLDVMKLPSEQFCVVDHKGELAGTLSKSEMIEGLSRLVNDLNEKEHTAEILSEILESTYEGIAVVDEHGILLEFNEAYSRFTGIDKKDAVGRHVRDVIDNTHLPETLKTGMPERGVIQYIQGQAMIVHRLPIWKNNKVVGAIGILIFEGVSEVYRIYERIQKNSTENQESQPYLSNEKLSKNKMTLDRIIGDSESAANIKRLARKVAKTNVTVLISGESGTGKEMYARGIHHLSSLSPGPFICVNCGAIPEALFESELFGYEEGAFTGAKKGGKPGKFELAANGTLFLDEIGEMPLMMQTKLLRVLQEKEVGRIGSVKEQPIELRIIAATNRNLKEMVAEGTFREDLYYRINVIEIPIPPLRDRSEDIPQLVSTYLADLCEKHQLPEKVITSEAMKAFLCYSWPGNIREVINTLEKLVVLVDRKTIELKDLPSVMKNGVTEEKEENEGLMKKAKVESEKELIRNTLREMKGNKSETAKALGIHRTTLYHKLKKYGL